MRSMRLSHTSMRLALAVLATGAVAGCGGESTSGAPASTVENHAYAAMSRPLAGPPPLFTAEIPAPARLEGSTSYRVGRSQKYPAYLVRTADGALCLYARGDDGIGGSCTRGGSPDHGVVALGEVRADGGYVLSIAVPDDVTAVTVKGRAHVPEDNLVSLNLPYEPASIEMASSRGDFALPVAPRRP